MASSSAQYHPVSYEYPCRQDTDLFRETSAIELQPLREHDLNRSNTKRTAMEPTLDDNEVVSDSVHQGNDGHTAEMTFPWMAVAALVSMFLLTGAAVGILMASNQSQIQHWKMSNVNIQPQVWLSVLSTILDALTLFALAAGAMVEYWSVASRGTTLGNMHTMYESQVLIGAVKSITRGPNKIAIATLLCLISGLRGPLFQRASLINSQSLHTEKIQREMRVAQVIPPKFFWPEGMGLVSSGMYTAYKNHLQQTPITLDDFDDKSCTGTCTGKVKGYGFNISCLNSEVPWQEDANSSLNTFNSDPSKGTVPIFNSSASMSGLAWRPYTQEMRDDFRRGEEAGTFQITNLYKTDRGCRGMVHLSSCSLRHAIVEYDIEVKNGIVALNHSRYQSDEVISEIPTWNMDEKMIEMLSIADEDDAWGPTSMWVKIFQNQYQQGVYLPNSDNRAKGNVRATTNSRDGNFGLARDMSRLPVSNVSCETWFQDPTPIVTGWMRELAFRSAVYVANDLDYRYPHYRFDVDRSMVSNWTQTVTLKSTELWVVYTISVPYMISAIIVSLLPIFAIAPLLLGWKTLPDRQLTFNPLIVAKAFDAPLLRNQRLQRKNLEKLSRSPWGKRDVIYSVDEKDGLLKMQEFEKFGS